MGQRRTDRRGGERLGESMSEKEDRRARDLFAAHAMAAMFIRGLRNHVDIAKTSFDLADAMMKERTSRYSQETESSIRRDEVLLENKMRDVHMRTFEYDGMRYMLMGPLITEGGASLDDETPKDIFPTFDASGEITELM